MAWSTKTVSEIVTDAVANHISVPEFQREFVWDNGKVRDLVDSLFRDYPIGQFLVWKPPSPYGSDADEEERRPTLWIVDGQQVAGQLQKLCVKCSCACNFASATTTLRYRQRRNYIEFRT